MTDLLQFLNSPPDDPREPHASHSIPKPLKEVPVSTGVDHLMKRPDVDPDRIARMGLSMDGYPDPRAAAFEHHLCACIACGAIHDFAEV